MAARKHADGSALLRAAALGDMEGVQRLITAAAAADAESGAAAAGVGSGTSATSTASVPGHSSRVQELLAGTFAKSKRQCTALHVAARAGHERVVAQLLAAGAPVNACDASGITPLWTAAANGHKSVVQQLLEAGTDVTAAAKPACRLEGWTVLHTAAAEDSARSMAVLQLLLDAGMAVNAGAGSVAGTALHCAASCGSVSAVKVHLGAGADVNAVDSNSTTPLHRAAASGRADVVAVLVDAGAKVNAVDRDGYTALCFAIGSRRLTCIKLLLAAGACCRDPSVQITASSMAATETISDWEFRPNGPAGRQAGLDAIFDAIVGTPVSAKALVAAAMAMAHVSYSACSFARGGPRWRAVHKLLVAAVQRDAAAAQAALQQDFPWIWPWHTFTAELVTGVLTEALLEAAVAAAALDSDAHHTAVQHMLVHVAALHEQQRQKQHRDE